MSEIVNLLKSIGEFFKMVIEFVVRLFNDLVYVVKLLTDTVLHLPDYLNWLPPAVVAVLVTTFAIVVIYKLLGREG